MLTIGQVARMAGTTVRAVRHYHQTGLLPEPPRAANGYRRYRSSDLNRLLRIRQLSDLGLALADIRRLVNGSADDRREALQTLHDQLAEEERTLARRRATIAELLAVEGDPAIPTRYRAYVNGLQASGASEELITVDADIVRTVSGLLSVADHQLIDDAVAAMAEDPCRVAALAAYMARLDNVATLPPDHPDVTALTEDCVAFLRESWPDLVTATGDEPETNPEMVWLIQDLLSERLTPAQARVVRDTMERLTTPNQVPIGGNEPNRASETGC